nr:hypothetical protein [uncultured Chitinophaga sp.]
MSTLTKYRIEVPIDKLTNSIVNTISGDSFETIVNPVGKGDLRAVSTKSSWKFDWKKEFRLKDRITYKLTIIDNHEIIQGLMSLSDCKNHYYIHLIESAPFNTGSPKLYEGVPGNLFAFACKQSQEQGYQGFVAFASKTRLISHYEKSLGATHIGNHKMIIFPENAAILINKYYKQ